MTEQARAQADRLLQAAGWQMRNESGDADPKSFAAWLADPLNAAAWSQLNGALGVIADQAGDRRMQGFRRAALEDVRRTRARRGRRRGMQLAAALLIGVLGGGAYHRLTAPEDYQTLRNERRAVMLADGSSVPLDSDTEVTVSYSTAARRIRLVRGQARFDVAHDAARPFSVRSRDEEVVATGTAFNVDMTQVRLLVTLIEGHVVVSDEKDARSLLSSVSRLMSRHPSRTSHRVELQAGQQLAAEPGRAPVISVPDMRAALAWTKGQLIFDNQPLAEVVARVSHYAPRPIVIADPRLAQLRISGSFNTGDMDGFLDIVTHYLPIGQATGSDGRVTLTEK